MATRPLSPSTIPFISCLLLTVAAAGLVMKHRGPGGARLSTFVWIPPGSFLMGSPLDEPGREPSEIPHRVTVSGFWMGRHPVTQAEWLQVMPVNPSMFRGSGQLPVEGVTWYDAIAYCNLRSLHEGLQPSYVFTNSGTDPRAWPAGWKQRDHDAITCRWTASGYRLPTEAEWEYACRAGTSTATVFGDALSSRQANFNGAFPYGTGEPGPNLRQTTPVGQYPPNPWGLFDMHGNISQWCWDRYGDYDVQAGLDPRGPRTAWPRRVHRGGSWFSHGVDLRAAARFSDTPFFRLDMLPGGLRLVRSGGAD